MSTSVHIEQQVVYYKDETTWRKSKTKKNMSTKFFEGLGNILTAYFWHPLVSKHPNVIWATVRVQRSTARRKRWRFDRDINIQSYEIRTEKCQNFNFEIDEISYVTRQCSPTFVSSYGKVLSNNFLTVLSIGWQNWFLFENVWMIRCTFSEWIFGCHWWVKHFNLLEKWMSAVKMTAILNFVGNWKFPHVRSICKG